MTRNIMTSGGVGNVGRLEGYAEMSLFNGNVQYAGFVKRKCKVIFFVQRIKCDLRSRELCKRAGLVTHLNMVFVSAKYGFCTFLIFCPLVEKRSKEVNNKSKTG